MTLCWNTIVIGEVPSAQARGFYSSELLWASSRPGNVVTFTDGGCDPQAELEPAVLNGTNRKYASAFTQGNALPWNPAKHSSLFKVQHVVDSIAQLFEGSKAAFYPSAQAQGLMWP